MAISLISPGIKITEQDVVASQQAVSSTVGAFAGQFQWGPVEDPTLVSSEVDLVTKFGRPTPNTSLYSVDFLSAANFLGYSQQLYVCRVTDDTANNATSDGSQEIIKNDLEYLNASSLTGGEFMARYPGELGNSLKVSVCPNANTWESNTTIEVTVTSGNSVITGTDIGSAANTGTSVGDLLVVSGRTFKITELTSANSVTVTPTPVANTSGFATRRWEYYGEFDAAPGTSTFVSARGGSGDEMHLVVVDEDGVITGVAGTVLEKYALVSKASDAKSDNGGVNYYKDVINNQSAWVRWAGTPTEGNSTWGNTSSSTTFTETTDLASDLSWSLENGSDGAVIDSDDRIRGYNYYASKEAYPASIIFTGQAGASVINRAIADIAETRFDTVVCFSPELTDVQDSDPLTAVLEFAQTITKTTYGFMDCGWKYQYNRYADNYIWVPLNADVAGCMARNDLNREPWISPAGYVNGQIQNIVRLAWNPTQAQRDALYKASINPIVQQVGKGTVLFGDKTFTTKNTSTNRINVRRLFIELQRTIGNSADNVLFDRNDDITRTNFVNLVSPYLRSVQARRGISAFRVVCDSTNNPESVVNANEFVCDIFVQPVRSVNFIQLNFVSVAGSATFTEIAA